MSPAAAASVAAPAASSAVASPSAAPAIQGRVDVVDRKRIFGWAWSPDHPAERLEVEVWHGSTRLGSSRADVARPDLRMHGIGDGEHAFEIVLDEALDESQMRDLTVQARVAGNEQRVPLARRSDVEMAAEAAVTPTVARLAEWMEGLRTNQQDLSSSQKAALRGIRELIGLCKAGGDGGPGAVQRMSEAHRRLDEQMEAFDVFLLRFDRTLQEMNAASAAQKAAGGRGGALPVALVAALAAAVGAVAGTGLHAWFETLLR